MSRFRLYPTAAQEAAMREHCAHARFVWNLAVEQQSWWRPGRANPPSYKDQSRQITEARAEFEWLRSGSFIVQQQALRDFDQALRNFFAGTHGKPTWRKQGFREGFRIVSSQAWRVEHLNKRWSIVQIPKIGMVRFRRSRSVPDAKSYRVTVDRSGVWHVAFAAIPEPIPAPGTGEIVGVDRGVRSAITFSNGETSSPLGLRLKEAERLLRLQQALWRAQPSSHRRELKRVAMATLHRKAASRRRDWTEKATTDLARRFDLIRIEDLAVGKMMRRPKPRPNTSAPGKYLPNRARYKAVLNRGIAVSAWATFARRLEDKAPGRVQKINPAFTSQRCSACGHVDRESRKSQADFRCTACGFACNADVNAAINIAAGHAVTARGGSQLEPANREPQQPASQAA